MSSKDGKVTLSAAVPASLKDRVQHIASERRWTLSQTLVVFLEEYLETWEKELGIGVKEPKPTPKKQKRSKTQ